MYIYISRFLHCMSVYTRYGIIYTQGIIGTQHLHSPGLHWQLYNRIKFKSGTPVLVTYASPQVQLEEPQPLWSLRGSLAPQVQPWHMEVLVEHSSYEYVSNETQSQKGKEVNHHVVEVWKYNWEGGPHSTPLNTQFRACEVIKIRCECK